MSSDVSSIPAMGSHPCLTCGTYFMGSIHSCTQADILRKVQELLQMVQRLNTATPVTPMSTTRTCPCRPEKGGSGICGCILSGPRVTCSVGS